jgi:cytoskeletal protein CcmA (bactofilin family)
MNRASLAASTVGAGGPDHTAHVAIDEKTRRTRRGWAPPEHTAPLAGVRSNEEGTMALKGLMTRGTESAGGAAVQDADRSGGAGSEAEATPRLTMTQGPGPRTVAPATSVDASSDFEGRLRCSETLRIDGRIVGEIACEKAVIIGEAGRVHACIEADDVQVAGIVEGDITARRKVTLGRTAVVVGDLTTPGIVIEEGAKLKGRIVIGSDAETEDLVARAKAQSTKPAEKTQAERSDRSEPEAPARGRKQGSTQPRPRANGSEADGAAVATA